MDRGRRDVLRPHAVLHRGVVRGEVALQREQEHDGVLGHLVLAVRRDVDDVHPPLCGAFGVDRVDADAAAGDDPTPVERVDDFAGVRRRQQPVDHGVHAGEFGDQVVSGLDVDRPERHVRPLEHLPFDVEVERAPRGDAHCRAFGTAGH